jgi:hypothetical protein
VIATSSPHSRIILIQPRCSCADPQIFTPAYLRKNWGVLVAVGVLYLAFGAMLLITRYNRAKQSYAYIA